MYYIFRFFLLMIIFYTSGYGERGKLLVDCKQSKDNMYCGSSNLPQSYAPYGFTTRTHTNTNFRRYRKYYPNARTKNKRGRINRGQSKYDIFQLYYRIFDTSIQADDHIKYWDKCSKNPYEIRTVKPGQVIRHDHTCPKLSIGDFSCLKIHHTRAICVMTKTGRLVTNICISSRPKKAKKYPYEILIPAPSDNDMIGIAPQFHNAIINYANANGWKIHSDSRLSSEPTQQPITIPKTNITANADISDESMVTKPKIVEAYDQCKDPNRDKAVEEYCQNKAYNERLKREEEVLDRAEEEAAIKSEKAYQSKLAKQKEENAYWEDRNKAYFTKQRSEALARAKKAEEEENKVFHNNIAKMQEDQKAKLENMKQTQEQTRTNLKLIDRFGGDIDTQLMAYEKVIALSNNADLDKATKINKAIRKQYFDSSQMRHQNEAEFQTAKAKEWDESIKRTKFIRDTSVTVNKILAIPTIGSSMLGTAAITKAGSTLKIGKIILSSDTLIATVIPFVHGATVNAVDAGYKDGIEGMLASLSEDTVNQLTANLGKDIIGSLFRRRQYYTTGVRLPDKMKVYDGNGYLVTRMKKGDKLYNEKKERVDFALRRLLRRQAWTKRARKDALSTDPNKITNVVIDGYGMSEKVAGVLWKVLKK